LNGIPPVGPLRFSRIYTEIDTLLKKPIVIQSTTTETILTVPPLISQISGASIFQANEPGNPNRDVDFPYPLMVCAMACCHSIKVVGGELMGDPLDLKMFQFTKWNIEEEMSTNTLKNPNKLTSVMTLRPPWIPSPESVSQGKHGEELFTELAVVKSFEFVSQLRRMSVISYRNRYSKTVISPNSDEDPIQVKRDFEVFVKGAPEVMRSICKPESRNFYNNNST
jgi:cation-transporting ATPase 13A3/4/5